MRAPAALVLRCDGARRMGYGHVARCVSLALHARAAGARCLFVAGGEAAAAELARARGFEVQPPAGPYGGRADADGLAALAAGRGACVVVDGYGFHADFYRRAGRGGPVLAVDDLARSAFPVELVLNQNAFGADLRYRTAPGTRLLLGPRYALLRPEFVAAASASARRPAAAASRRRARVLLTFGATDAAGLSGRFLDLLGDGPLVDRLEARVLLGPGADATDARRAAGRARFPVELRIGKPVAREMAWADLAVSAAGSTIWELLCMGVPAAVVAVADNQRRAAASLGGRVLDLGTADRLDAERVAATLAPLVLDPARRAALAARGRRTVDGLGAGRVLRALAAAAGGRRP